MGSFDADSAKLYAWSTFNCYYHGKAFNEVEVGWTMTSNANFFHKVKAETLDGNGNHFDSLSVNDIYTYNDSAALGKNVIDVISNYNQLPDLSIHGSQVSISKFSVSNITDVQIQSGDTLFLSGNLNLNAGWLFSGQSAFISCGSSLPSCISNTNISNIHILSVAPFYADTSCTDYGGNAGWTWAPCSPVGNVWPGDANDDLAVNNFDVLNIGLAYNGGGPVRAGASLAWTGQVCTDWASNFANGTNHKHADTDGNGFVNNNDTAAITLNYGLTHPFRLSEPSINTLGTPFYILPSTDSVALGDTLYVDFMLGTSAIPIDSIYGVSFTFNFDTALVNIGGFAFDYSNCWMGIPGTNLLCYSHPRFNDQVIDFTVVRTNHIDVSGFGSLLRLRVVIADNAGASMNLPFTLSNVVAISLNEDLLPLAVSSDSVSVDTTAITGISSLPRPEDGLKIFPNPAKEKFVISSPHKINSIELYDVMGERVFIQSVNKSITSIYTQQFSKGIYNAKITTDNGIINRKIVVVK